MTCLIYAPAPLLAPAGMRQVCNELWLQQSAADSTSPQIDVAAGVLWEFHIERDVSQLQAAAGLR